MKKNCWNGLPQSAIGSSAAMTVVGRVLRSIPGRIRPTRFTIRQTDMVLYSRCLLTQRYLQCCHKLYTNKSLYWCSDKRLPQKPNSYEVKLHHVEMERLKKWEKMTKQWDSASTKEKLRRRIYKGIPNRFRGQVWTLLLGIKNLKKEQAGKYEEMLKLARQWSTEIRQIDADVARQYRDHINYRCDAMQL